MKVRIVRISDDYELNIRYTDEIAEEEEMSDIELDEMENGLRTMGRWYLDSNRMIFPVK